MAGYWETQLAAAGALADVAAAGQAKEITDLGVQVTDLTAELATADAEIVRLNAIINGTPPPPPPSKTLVGASCGGVSVNNLTEMVGLLPGCKVIRVYSPGAATKIGANVQFLAAVAFVRQHGGEVWYSFKADPTDTTWTDIVKDWSASGVTIRWTYNHEADNPAKSINATSFKLMFNHLIALANTVAGPNVTEQSIFMAYMLDPKHPHGDPESWYVSGARTLGFDCYNLGYLPLVIDYAKSKGKPYTLPEFGGGGRSDTAALAAAQGFGAVFAGPDAPLGAAWFNADGTGLSTYLRNIPMTTAYLNTLT